MSDSPILQGVDPATEPSFSLRNRLGRSLWSVAWMLLFRTSPRPLHAWRSFLLRLFGARLGRGCHVYPSVRIWAPWNLRMGEHACLAEDVICYNIARVDIGARTTVSQGAFLCTGGHDYEDPGFQLIARPIAIGDRAWVCARVFINPGVAVGEGAVVYAGSVVVRALEPWSVSGGNPCRKIRGRRIREQR